MSSKDLPVYVYPTDLLKDNARCVSFIAINSLKTNGSSESKDKGEFLQGIKVMTQCLA